MQKWPGTKLSRRSTSVYACAMCTMAHHCASKRARPRARVVGGVVMALSGQHTRTGRARTSMVYARGVKIDAPGQICSVQIAIVLILHICTVREGCAACWRHARSAAARTRGRQRPPLPAGASRGATRSNPAPARPPAAHTAAARRACSWQQLQAQPRPVQCTTFAVATTSHPLLAATVLRVLVALLLVLLLVLVVVVGALSAFALSFAPLGLNAATSAGGKPPHTARPTPAPYDVIQCNLIHYNTI